MADWKFLGGITALGGLIGYFGAKTIDTNKLPAGEKAVLTGASTGATMEGLDLALGAEGCDHVPILGVIIEETDDGVIAEMTCVLCGAEGTHYMDSDLNDLDSEWDAEYDFSQKSAEGDYEPSFDSLKERIEWMEFAVGDENWYQYEEDYIDVVLDIEEWNENNANNSKLSNLVKQYKDRSFFRAESKNARISWRDACKHGTINQMGGVNYCEKQFEGKCEPCGNRFCKIHLFTTQAGTFCFSCLPVELGAESFSADGSGKSLRRDVIYEAWSKWKDGFFPHQMDNLTTPEVNWLYEKGDAYPPFDIEDWYKNTPETFNADENNEVQY